MATLFQSLPSAGAARGVSVGGGNGGVALGNGADRALQWVGDEEARSCMLCSTPFSVLTRKHHCRRCGNVICHNCSPHKRRIAATDPFPMRVCNTCYAAVDEHFASLEWSGNSSMETQLQAKANPVIEGRVHIGQLYVKVVEAIGLPSTDSITSDPFVRVILTGKWSHGQEWGNDLKSIKCTKKKSRTLNPRWHETFVFNVCAPGAEIVLEVYNYGQLSQPTKLGETSIPLSDLMDQRRHNKWLDLMLPENLHRAGMSNDARAGRIHLLLHYRFSRMAEFCSYFGAEQEFEHEWPRFEAGQLYSNFWILLDDLWPYLELIWQIVPTLNWEHPSHSFVCFALCVWLCLSIQWLPVVLHLALIAITLRNYFELNMHSFSVHDPKDTSQTELDQAAQFRQTYNLPTGFSALMNKMTHVTVDHETKQTLQSVQNNMAWWSNILRSVELMFSWEDTFYTAKVLLLLTVSCILYIFIPNKYLLLALVVYLFVQYTVPFQYATHFFWAMKQAIRSIIHQQRLINLRRQSDTSLAAHEAVLAVSAHKRKSFDKTHRHRRTASNVGVRMHQTVLKKEEMFGAAASAISERFVVHEDPSQLPTRKRGGP